MMIAASTASGRWKGSGVHSSTAEPTMSAVTLLAPGVRAPAWWFTAVREPGGDGEGTEQPGSEVRGTDRQQLGVDRLPLLDCQGLGDADPLHVADDGDRQRARQQGQQIACTDPGQRCAGQPGRDVLEDRDARLA